jgi:flagellar biosynthesis protein FlhA
VIVLADKTTKSLFKNNFDMVVPLLIIGIVMMIIIPVPPPVLDVLIIINITISILIIMMTMFNTEVLQFSVFPTMLLITTLFRLALNISSTRQILSNAYAGEVIQAFGDFVVGGSYIVGIIIFLIIMVVQFIVITNGAGRVAEVGARFTLDAMPGKQMSIDADLNAGIIDEMDAKERRKKLQQEADFYGAMDGASKFVKGDAIAGIIIVVINIIGGIIIGATVHGMDIGTAAATYVKLTVGDGLVGQIPALLISTSAGILVTKSGSEDNLGKTLTKQFTTFPKAIALAAGVLFLLGIVPGLPTIPFFILASTCGVGAYLLIKDEKTKVIEENHMEKQKSEEAAISREPENVMSFITVEPMEVEIGYGLIPLADEGSGGDLLQRVASVRRQCAIEMGIIVQPIRIRDNLQLKTNQYVIKIRGTVAATGELMANMMLCMDPTNETLDIAGIKTVEPTFGLPAVWIDKYQREEAELKGLTVVDPTTVMITHLTETIKMNSHELLGRQEVKLIIDSVRERYSAVVEELIPDLLTIGEVQKVLQNLLKEKVSIKDMVTILESLADNARNTKDLELLTEYVRFALARTICNPLVDEYRTITVATLDPSVEEIISNNLQKSMQGTFPAVDPETTGNILASIREVIQSTYFYENQPVFLVSPRIRPAFKRLIEMIYPNIIVLSLNEIPNDVEIKTEGVVTIA